MNTKEKIRQYLDANVHDGEDREGCHGDKAVFTPDELQVLVEEACEYALKKEEGQAAVVSDFKTCSKRWATKSTLITCRKLDPNNRIIVRKTNNKGMQVKRTRFNPRELAFAEAWADESTPKSFIDYGLGLVQNLFVTDHPRWPFRAEKVIALNNRERMIAATCIQWLGSNCGMDFLGKSLEKCGYSIVKLEKESQND